LPVPLPVPAAVPRRAKAVPRRAKRPAQNLARPVSLATPLGDIESEEGDVGVDVALAALRVGDDGASGSGAVAAAMAADVAAVAWADEEGREQDDDDSEDGEEFVVDLTMDTDEEEGLFGNLLEG
jgi:hypothetical protein